MTIELEVEQRPVVVRDQFPVEVTTPDGALLRSARALLTRERLYVFQAHAGQPRLVLSLPYLREGSKIPETYASRSQGTHLVLEDGGQAHVNRQSGCGCGNPLKAAPLSVLLPGASKGVLV